MCPTITLGRNCNLCKSKFSWIYSARGGAEILRCTDNILVPNQSVFLPIPCAWRWIKIDTSSYVTINMYVWKYILWCFPCLVVGCCLCFALFCFALICCFILQDIIFNSTSPLQRFLCAKIHMQPLAILPFFLPLCTTDKFTGAQTNCHVLD